MDSSVDSFMDDLAARTTIEHYGNISLVDIPNCSTLSQSQKTAIFMKAEQWWTATPQIALLSRLRCITPPLDDEENEESRLLEAQARRELEIEGCPSCYPSNLDIPLRNPPKKYEQIIYYWQSFSGTGDVVLCAQLSDWRKFRMFQRRSRDKNFSEYVNKVRERRHRYGLGGDFRLLIDPKQQTRLEGWMEFQNYHLHGLEQLEKKRDRFEKELVEARTKSGNMDVKVNAEAVQQLLEDAKRDVKRHKDFLQWIEHERQTMDRGCPAPIKEGDQDAPRKAVRRPSTRHHRTRRRAASTVLGRVRVSKATPKKPNTQMQKSRTLEFEPVIQIDANPQSSIPPAPKRRGTNSRSIREEVPIRAPRSQRVCKAKRFANASTKLLTGTQRRGAASENVTTRSGRMSRPPVRWDPA